MHLQTGGQEKSFFYYLPKILILRNHKFLSDNYPGTLNSTLKTSKPDSKEVVKNSIFGQ